MPAPVAEDAALSAERAESRDAIASHNRKQRKSGGFQSLGLSPAVYKGIVRKGYRVPTPIQRKTMPHILAGRDVVAMARTGSGKTAAFLVPLLERLRAHQCNGARALVLSPTRELALQTLDFCRALGRYTDLTVALVLGGDSMEQQFSALHSNPDIVVACPGRLLHLLTEMDAKLSQVEFLVLDECDRLFELGFQEQLQLLLSRLPAQRQTLLFSATLPQSVAEFARAGLSDPLLVRLDVDAKLSEQLTASFLLCRDEDKLPVLLHLLHTALKDQELTIVFVATKHHVEWLYQVLSQDPSISVTYLYSSLDPAARRLHAANFRSGERHVLITTDLAARGLDLPRLNNVVNFHFPPREKLFVHRVGRVARAGRPGRAVSLLAPDELPHLFDLELFLGARRLRYLTAADSEPAPRPDEPGDLVGSVPAAAVEEFADWCRHRHDISADLRAQLDCAKRAMAHYLRSRPGASREAVTKCKEARRTGRLDLQPHPMFASLVTVKDDVLKQIRAYRARATVFETKNAPAAVSEVMQKFRQKNRRAIEKAKTQKRPSGWLESALRNVKPPEANQDDADAAGDVKTRASGFFMPYTRDEATAATERGLALDLQRHSMDILADETDQMRRSRTLGASGRVWDRKRKKFVSAEAAAGPSAAKRLLVRTESGQLVPASYKTDRYAKWRKRNPDVDGSAAVTMGDGGDGDSDDGGGEEGARVGAGGRRGGGGGRGRGGGRGGIRVLGLQRKRHGPTASAAAAAAGAAASSGKASRGERKSVEQIVKARHVRERNKLNNRKGGKRRGGGGGGGRGGRRGK